MLKLKQYFCGHDFEKIAKHEWTQQRLWHCRKCGVYKIEHWGIGVSYLHKTPHIPGWIVDKEETE